MFRSKKSIKIANNRSLEANVLNDETVGHISTVHVNDQTHYNHSSDNLPLNSDETNRIYMNLPHREVSADELEEPGFLSPTVKVKHDINYEYDEKKFEIFKDEYLYLINRTNNDWWLCLRLDENLTFFVPASYLDEVDANSTPKPNLAPPPRPPPPPPKPQQQQKSSTQNENTTSDSIMSKAAPEVKQRQQMNTANEKRQAMEYSAAEAIINDLEQRLDHEERNFSQRTLHLDEQQSEDKQIYENMDELNVSKKAETTDDTFDDDDDEEDNEEDDEEDDNTEANTARCNENLKLMNRLKVPNGWKMCMSSCNRYIFYNDLNREIWYLNYDAYGKHYFYNKDGVSVWQLKELEIKEEDIKESPTHFQRHFDEDLETFNNLYSRLSVRQHSNEASSGTLTFSTLNDNLSEMSKSSKSKTSDSSGASSTKSASVPNEFFKCIRLVENGKKHKKKTAEELRVYLANPKVLFVKIQKGGLEKLEFSLDLKNAKCFNSEALKNVNSNNNVYSNKDKNNNQSSSKSSSASSSKSNSKRDKEVDEIFELINNSKSQNNSAFLIETLNSSKILLIHENVNTINDWVTILNSIINQISDSADAQLCESEPVLKPSKYNNFRHKQTPPAAITSSAIQSATATSSSIQSPTLSRPPLPNGPPPTKIISNTNVFRNALIKNFLSLFLNRRPTIEQLKNKGIIQECIFGSNLINLCRNEKRSVPIFVEEIIACIEYKGLEVDGIYRISGNLAEVQKVRLMVDQGKTSYKDFDIHVLCGALKTFFRELEEPLIPFSLHQEFLNSINLADKTKRFEKIRELLKLMPFAHRETLKYLSQHLLRVIEVSAQNRMNIQNIALVFGPNIMRSNPINDANNGFNPNIMTQNILVEYILNNFKDLFYSSSTTSDKKAT